ncbi:hypothetical protein K438DRAFT_1939644 [Mycena galopus ATCC 62051]|nr:hypothetical protein K438DRAFT_1939644 [Mycena galopus ATCC 62051]
MRAVLRTLHLGLLFALAATQDRTTEAGEAQIDDRGIRHLLVPALSPQSDTVGRAEFLAMNASIPNIPPKGTMAGDFSNFTPTYPPTDPTAATFYIDSNAMHMDWPLEAQHAITDRDQICVRECQCYFPAFVFFWSGGMHVYRVSCVVKRAVRGERRCVPRPSGQSSYGVRRASRGVALVSRKHRPLRRAKVESEREV